MSSGPMSTQPVTLTARIRGLFAEVDWRRVDRWLLLALIAAFLLSDLQLLRAALPAQPFGNDFLPLWTGARADPARLYDFGYVTDLQSWLYADKVRPFVYPPSALLLFKPLALLPFWPAYIALVALSGALFLWTGTKLGADGRLLIAATPLLLVAMAGQVTFLVGALVMAAVMARGRPLLSGLLFGLAGAIKPPLLVLLPLALIVEGNWRTFLATGATALACGLLSLPFGASWPDWLAALPKFSQLVANDPGLVATTLTPYAQWGAWSYLFSVPAALAAVWLAFRRGDPAQRLLALLGGALLVSPYAMNYAIALVIPAVLALKRPLVWSLPFWWALLYFFSGPLPLIIAMTLLFVSLRRAPAPPQA
jgi:hypothetical protein